MVDAISLCVNSSSGKRKFISAPLAFRKCDKCCINEKDVMREGQQCDNQNNEHENVNKKKKNEMMTTPLITSIVRLTTMIMFVSVSRSNLEH